MTRARRLACALLLLVAAAAAFADDALGRRVDVDFTMAGLRASQLDVAAGLDIARFLGLGVLWGMGYGDPGIVDLGVGVWCTATLLSESGMGLPVSLVIDGSFRKLRSLGQALAAQSVVRSGTAGTLGVTLSRTWRSSDTLGLVTALRGTYSFDTMTTEAIAGSGSTFATLIVPVAQYAVVARLAIAATLAERLGIEAGVEAGLDGSLTFLYGPTFSLVYR